MNRSSACLAFGLICFISVTAFASGSTDARVSRVVDQSRQTAKTWQATEKALDKLGKRRDVRGVLKARGEVIVLAERSGSRIESLPFHMRSLHGIGGWLGDHMTFFSPVKVEWQERLVLGHTGVSLYSYQRTAVVDRDVLDAARADIDAQFADKTRSHVTMPKLAMVPPEPTGEFTLTGADKVKTGFLSRGMRLTPTYWQNIVSPEIIDAQLAKWAAE